MRAWFAAGIAGLVLSVMPSDAAAVHAIIVANTDNPALGPSAQTNMTKIQSLLYDTVRDMGEITVDDVTISGKDFNCQNIEKALAGEPVNGKRLKITSDKDAVVFYYAGHGYLREPMVNGDRFPTLLCSSIKSDRPVDPKLDLSLTSIVNRIAAMNPKPRFVLAIADACSTPVTFHQQEIARAIGNAYKNGLHELFLGYGGKLIITAASPGEDSNYFDNDDPRGGIFTIQFLSAIDNEFKAAKHDHRPAHWEGIEDRATAAILPEQWGVRTAQHPMSNKTDSLRNLRVVPQPD